MNARRLKKKINPECKDVSIQVSYGTSDVRNSLKKMYDFFCNPCGETFALSRPVSEPELLQYFENTLFKEYEAGTSKELSRWAFVQAKKFGFIITGTSENAYYLSPQLAKRAGRPRKEAGE